MTSMTGTAAISHWIISSLSLHAAVDFPGILYRSDVSAQPIDLTKIMHHRYNNGAQRIRRACPYSRRNRGIMGLSANPPYVVEVEDGFLQDHLDVKTNFGCEEIIVRM